MNPADPCRPAPVAGGAGAVPPWIRARRRALRRGARARSVGRPDCEIAALLLDVGGVVIPTLFETVAVEGFPTGPFAEDPGYAAVERGDRQERDYWAGLAEHRPDLDIRALWQACSYVRGEVRDGLSALAGRVKVVAFTNDMAHWFGDGWPHRFPELAQFDDVLEAAKLGPLKPDPAAFRRAAEAIGEPPDRCLFVDDLAGNLAGAQSVGMATLLFDVRDPQRGMRALLRRLA